MKMEHLLSSKITINDFRNLPRSLFFFSDFLLLVGSDHKLVADQH